MTRILHIVTDMNAGGIETMIMNLYRNIDRSLIQFDFLIHKRDIGFYGEEIERLGGRVFRVPSFNPLSRSYKKALCSFFNTHKEYSTVHCHVNVNCAYILGIAKKCGVKNRISHCHTAKARAKFPKCIAKSLLLMHSRLFCKKNATHMLACSQNAAEWLYGTRTAQQDNAYVFRNPIDSEKFRFNTQMRAEIRNSYGITEDGTILGHIGRFSAVKNHGFLIDVFYEYKKSRQNSVLLLVGDGSLRASLEEKCRELGVEGSVIFTGLRTDTAALLSAMDIFVFPSEYEGLGLSAIEAQASGLPVICSDAVPMEAVVTEKVKRLALSLGTKDWAEALLAVEKSVSRERAADIIKGTDYDIVRGIDALTALYLKGKKHD